VKRFTPLLFPSSTALLCALLIGCFGGLKPVTKTIPKRQQQVPIVVRVDSDPPGAQVFLEGDSLPSGTTPCEIQRFTLDFQDFALVNTQSEAPKLGAVPASAGGAYSIHDRHRTTDVLAAEPFRVSVRLEKEGYLPLQLSHEVAPREIPILRTQPVITLHGTLVSDSVRP